MLVIFWLLVVIFLLMLVISRIKAVANQGAVARDAIEAKDRSKDLLQLAAIHIYDLEVLRYRFVLYQNLKI